MHFRLFAAATLLLLLTACAGPSIYTNESFSNYQNEHKLVAVLPYDVEIQLKKLPEGLTADDLEKMEEEEGFLFQQQLYAQFLERYGKGKYTVGFQDVEKTNILLERAGIDYEKISRHTKEELAETLGVDAVISGDIKRSKPMSTGWAVASTVLIGWGTTNTVNVNMRIHDGKNGEMIWSYDHDASGGVASSAEGLAKALMRNVSKKFPYKKS